MRNTSRLVDKSYALWATEDIKRALAPLYAKPDEHKAPYLWFDDSFVWLLTPASDLVPCSHVCEGSGLLRSGSVTVSSPDGTGRVVGIPEIIESGKEGDIDLIFSAPKVITDYRLLVLGSAPTRLKITPAGKPVEEGK